MLWPSVCAPFHGQDADARPEEGRRTESQVLRLVGGPQPARLGQTVDAEERQEGESLAFCPERAAPSLSPCSRAQLRLLLRLLSATRRRPIIYTDASGFLSRGSRAPF